MEKAPGYFISPVAFLPSDTQTTTLMLGGNLPRREALTGADPGARGDAGARGSGS
jgi:hypothetical protein